MKNTQRGKTNPKTTQNLTLDQTPLLKSKLRRALESQRTKGTAVRGLRLYSIIISKYYTPAVRELRLREKVHPTAANINLTKL